MPAPTQHSQRTEPMKASFAASANARTIIGVRSRILAPRQPSQALRSWVAALQWSNTRTSHQSRGNGIDEVCLSRLWELAYFLPACQCQLVSRCIWIWSNLLFPPPEQSALLHKRLRPSRGIQVEKRTAVTQIKQSTHALAC